MTDNEKRAHDLAVAICVDTCHIKVNSQIANAKTDTSAENTEVIVKMDYFTEYMNAYDLALEAFNKRFPDGSK